MYDGSTFFRTFSGNLEGYLSTTDLAARSIIVSTVTWQGENSDSMFAIPEPSYALLFGIGSVIIALLIRHMLKRENTQG